MKLKHHGYPIMIGDGILESLGAYLKKKAPGYLGRHALIVTNRRIARLHSHGLLRGLAKADFTAKVFTVPDTEASKSFGVVQELVEKMARYDVKKNVFLIALGGGVIGDLAGFVAAVYKRGIPYIQVPTTFLAQIDSAVGGKVAIDLDCGKNLVGAFYQPILVWSDIGALSTLSRRQMRNGMAEAVKYGIIRDRMLFSFIQENSQKLFAQETTVLRTVVERCCRIKAEVVRVDERETKGVRTILNFGHTIGHAIESASGFTLQHGEAIAVGMRVACEISLNIGMTTERECRLVHHALDRVGLPKRASGLSRRDILQRAQFDKKNTAGATRFVCLECVGRVKVIRDIPLKVIRRCLQPFLDE